MTVSRFWGLSNIKWLGIEPGCQINKTQKAGLGRGDIPERLSFENIIAGRTNAVSFVPLPYSVGV